MADHLRPAAGRDRASWSTRIRVALSLGIATGLSGVGTMALWSSSATVTPPPLTSAQLDITVDGGLAGAANRDGISPRTTWNMADMLPGEQRALSFTVANTGVGDIPVDIRLNAYATGTLGPALRFTFFDGGTATNTGGSLTAPLASTYRTGTCPGGVQIGAAALALGASAAAASVVDSTKQTLAVGQSHTYCVIVALDNTAATHTNASLGNATSTASFLVRGTQSGAP